MFVTNSFQWTDKRYRYIETKSSTRKYLPDQVTVVSQFVPISSHGDISLLTNVCGIGGLGGGLGISPYSPLLHPSPLQHIVQVRPLCVRKQDDSPLSADPFGQRVEFMQLFIIDISLYKSPAKKNGFGQEAFVTRISPDQNWFDILIISFPKLRRNVGRESVRKWGQQISNLQQNVLEKDSSNEEKPFTSNKTQSYSLCPIVIHVTVNLLIDKCNVSFTP